MTRFTRTTLSIGAVAAIALGLTACAAGGADDTEESGPQKLLVATGGEPRPYSFVGDDGETLTGYDIELLRLIDEKVDDIEFEYQLTEFPGIFAGLDSGAIDIGANNFSATEERKEKYNFSDPYIEAQFGIILPDDSEADKIKTLDDLAGKKAYGQAGINFTKVLESYNEQNPDAQIEIEYTEADLQTQYQSLATGAVDFLFNEEVVFNGYAADKGYDYTFVPLDGDYLTENFGTNLLSAFIISKHTKNADHVIEEINTALGELKESGELVALSEEFFDGLDVTPKS